MTPPSCTFCGQPVHLDGATIHPCCAHAQARGERECFGCERYRRRLAEGKR